MKHPTAPSVDDLESSAIGDAHLNNVTIQSLAWGGIHVRKNSWKTDARPASILSDIDGYAEAGT